MMKLMKFFFGILLLSPAVLRADDTAVYQLVHKPAESSLNYLATYYAQTTDVLSISQTSGEEETYTNRSYEYIEAQKELTRSTSSPQALTIESTVKTHYLKKIHQNKVAPSISPETRSGSQSAIGRLVVPFLWEDILHLGLPILFPREAVGPGAHWEKSIDFRATAYPAMVMKLNYELRKVGPWQANRAVEIVYTLHASLDSTKLSMDTELRQQLNELKQSNIESVSFEGQGEILFDLDRGLPITHNVALNEMVRKNTIKGTERMVQDILTTHEFSEALVN